MIPIDILLVVIVLAIIIFFVNLSVKNARYINKSVIEVKLDKIDSAVKKSQNDVSKPSKNENDESYEDNYLHAMFNENDKENKAVKPLVVEDFDDVDKVAVDLDEDDHYENDTLEDVGAKFKNPNFDFQNNSTANIVTNADKNMSDRDDYSEIYTDGVGHHSSYQDQDYDQDYAIGVDDELEYTSELSKEFEALSPQMKAFITSNLMKNKLQDISDYNLSVENKDVDSDNN